MTFTKYETISFPGTEINEDIAYASDFCGWIIDGATGLNNKILTPSDSDAKWYAEQWHGYLLKNISNMDIDLKTMISNGIDIIKEQFYNEICASRVDKLDIPSGCIAVIRLRNDKIEYFVLGDCLILYKKGNTSLIIQDDKLKKFDGEVIKLISKLMSEGQTFPEARQRVKNQLIRNRLLRNTSEGYWVLEFDKSTVDNAVYGEIEDINPIKLLLMSDGFYSICDTFNLIEYNDLITAVEDKGLEYLYRILRNTENLDSECVMYPRLKKSDDSSAVFLTTNLS